MKPRPAAFRVAALAVAVAVARTAGIGAAGAGAADWGTPLAPPPEAAVATPEPTVAPLPAAPGDGFESPGTTTRVSLGLKGEQLRTLSGPGSIAGSGRYVAFWTSNYTNGYELGRILLRDRVAKTTKLVDAGSFVVSDTASGPVAVSDPTISADGRWVAYTRGSVYSASTRIYLWDRQTGKSSAMPPAAATGFVDQPSLSSDGSVVAFRTDLNLARNDLDKTADIYVYDRGKRSFELVSLPSQTCAAGDASAPSISANGRFVAFSVTCTTPPVALPGGLEPGAQPQMVVGAQIITGTQIMRRDRQKGTTALVSASAKGAASSGSSFAPSISADGQHVAFESTSPDIVPGDINGADDVFLWTSGSATIRVSVTTEGAEAHGASGEASISADGRLIAFSSDAADLVPKDQSPSGFTPPRDIFVHDAVSGRTTRISIGYDGSDADGTSRLPVIDATGNAVAFTSQADNLVPGAAGGIGVVTSDVYVRDRPGLLTLDPNPLDFGTLLPAGTASQTATIGNSGSGPVQISTVALAGPNASAFAIAGDVCKGTLVYPGESCAVAVQIAGSSSGVLAAQLTVTDDAPGSPHALPITALVSNAKLELSPRVGPPGTVVGVKGSGFAPGKAVTLAWDPSLIRSNVLHITAGTDGTFVAQMLIMPNDALGPRKLVATSETATAKITADADCLVVPRSAQPPSSWFVRQETGIRWPLVDRR